ncbi:MFS transporter [Pseudomonas graminis]|nr:MFS transporter [Pseudomonas graminis]
MLSQLFVSAGDGFFGVLVTYLALEHGSSVSTLGVIAFCVTFPRGLLGILGGALADQYDRKKLMVCCDVIRWSGLLIISSLSMFGALDVALLAGVGSIVTASYAVSKPASKAFVPSVVGLDELVLANGLIQSVLWPAFFAGAGLVGILSFLGISPEYAVLVCACFFVASQISLAGIICNPCKKSLAKGLLATLRQLIDAGRALKSNRALMVRITGYFFFTVFWRGLIQIVLPLYVVHKLHQPPSVYSVLMVACGVGELVSSLLLGKSRYSHSLKLAFVGEGILGLAVAVLAFSYFNVATGMAFAVVASVLIGVSATVIDIPLVTSIQKNVKDREVGKVFSFWSALGALGGSFGTIIVSGLVSLAGIDSALLWMSCCLIFSVPVFFLVAYRN